MANMQILAINIIRLLLLLFFLLVWINALEYSLSVS